MITLYIYIKYIKYKIYIYILPNTTVYIYIYSNELENLHNKRYLTFDLTSSFHKKVLGKVQGEWKNCLR